MAIVFHSHRLHKHLKHESIKKFFQVGTEDSRPKAKAECFAIKRTLAAGMRTVADLKLR